MGDWDSLFREIGDTLKETAKATIRQGTATLRSVLAERFAGTSTGQQIITEFKFREIGKMLPLLIGIVLAVFFVGWIARRA